MTYLNGRPLLEATPHQKEEAMTERTTASRGTSVPPLSSTRVRAIVRRTVGRRSRISRADMADLLVAIADHDLPALSTIYGQLPDGSHLVGHQIPALPPTATESEVARAQAIAWANMVQDITVISVLPGEVRHGAGVFDSEIGNYTEIECARCGTTIWAENRATP